MSAPVGLVFVLVSWGAVQTATWQAHASSGSWLTHAIANRDGWLVGIVPEANLGPEWSVRTDLFASDATLYDNYLIIQPVVPGVQYRRAGGVIGHFLKIDHPFICLLFLVATIGSIWSWRKERRAAIQQEAVD